MPVNAGKRHVWEYCPRRYLPANTASKCHRPTLSKTHYVVHVVFDGDRGNKNHFSFHFHNIFIESVR